MAAPSGVKSLLSKKVGPLPLPVVLAAVAVGGFVLWRRMSHSNSAVGGDTGDGVVSLVTGADGNGQAGAGYAPGYTTAPTDQLSPDLQAQLQDYRASFHDAILTAFDEGNAATASILAAYGGVQPSSSSTAGALPALETAGQVTVTAGSGGGSGVIPAKTAQAAKSLGATVSSAAAAVTKVSATQKPAATRYYTFAPGTKLSSLPKGYGSGDIAPKGAKFRSGKGYYVA